MNKHTKHRDLGMGANGKGDKDRTTDGAAFSRNFDEIDFSSVCVSDFGVNYSGFERTSTGQKKVYGLRAAKKIC